MLALVKYSLLRLALFAVALGVLWVLGAGWVAAVIGAGLISMMLSYIVLRGPRQEVADRIERHAHHRIVAAQQRVAAGQAQDTAIEDAVDDARRAQPPSPAGDQAPDRPAPSPDEA